MRVFPTEHPHFMSWASADGKSRVRGTSYPIKATAMKKRFNDPDVQFLVEVSLPCSGIVIHRYVIELSTGRGHGEAVKNRLFNMVQKDLSSRSEDTGAVYRLVEWGDVLDRSAWLAGAPVLD